MIRKVFHGLLPYEFPAGIKFQITDPTGNTNEYVLRADNTILLDNIQPGSYTITEVGYQVDGFDVRTTPGVTVRVTVPDGQQPEIVIFDNFYSLPQPPPQQPPGSAPQTGLPSHAIYYAILIAGILTMVCISAVMLINKKPSKIDDTQNKKGTH